MLFLLANLIVAATAVRLAAVLPLRGGLDRVLAGAVIATTQKIRFPSPSFSFVSTASARVMVTFSGTDRRGRTTAIDTSVPACPSRPTAP